LRAKPAPDATLGGFKQGARASRVSFPDLYQVFQPAASAMRGIAGTASGRPADAARVWFAALDACGTAGSG
jgi:hypothetical protein